MITFAELLHRIRSEVLVEFSGRAALVEHNPAARWLGRLFVAELARRRGDPAAALEPLTLTEDETEFAVEWLDGSADVYLDAAAAGRDACMLALAALLDQLKRYIERTRALPVQ